MSFADSGSRAPPLVPARPKIELQLSPVSRSGVFPFLAMFFCWLCHFNFLTNHSQPFCHPKTSVCFILMDPTPEPLRNIVWLFTAADYPIKSSNAYIYI
jgi:hypothetical protein